MMSKRFSMGLLRDTLTIPAMCGLALCVLFPSSLHAETKTAHLKEWLGSYIGGNIPGYQVKKTIIVQASGWQSADQMIKAEGKKPLFVELADICKDASGGGIALINLQTVIVLGQVPGPREAPNTYISNGMYRENLADCVIEAVPIGK